MQTEILNLDPSDVLVLRTPAYLHATQRESVIADIKAQLGAGAKVIVLDGGLDLQVLRPAAVTEVQQDYPTTSRTLIVEVARDYERYRRQGGAPEQVAVVEMLRKEFDSADREKRAGRGRLQYVIERAEELDAEDAALAAAEVDDKPGIPAHTWVPRVHLVGEQQAFAISHDPIIDAYAIRDEDLTDAQRVEYKQVSVL
jgi:hypothetical protein